MFPSSVLECLDNATPKLNPLLASGLAVEHLLHVETYIDDVFKAAAAGFPEGMKYLGCRRCTPLEEYAVATRKKINRCVFEVARSDVYLMEYKFSYKDEELPSRFLFLPFVSKAGTIHLGGSRFVISPILSDRVISIGISSVFVRLLKAKLTFNRVAQHYRANGERESVQVAWSEIYNEHKSAQSPKPTVDARCTLVHYLLCKYGFAETFKRFGNCVPIVGNEEINEENYPPEQWVICASAQIKPKGFGKLFYEPSPMRLAIARSEYTAVVKNLVGGFFYIVDHFPTMMQPDYVNIQRQWMIMLGHLIWSGNVSAGTLHRDVEDHIASLDEYVDSLVRGKLLEAGYAITDIYQLFGLIIDKFNEWVISSDDRVNTMYDKELSILYYVCYSITAAIFKLYFKLKAAQKKPMEKKKIAKIMDLNLKPGLIYKITREHGEVTTTSTSGDNMALKITNLLVPQSSSSRNRSKKDRVAISDPGKRLHASIAEVGGYANLPKSEPTGRSRLNMHLNISESGLVLRNPKFIKLIDSTQAKFGR